MTSEEIERAVLHLLHSSENLLKASQAQAQAIDGINQRLAIIGQIQEVQARNIDNLKETIRLQVELAKLDRQDMKELKDMVRDYLRGIRNGG